MSRIQEIADLIRVTATTVTVPSDKELYQYWNCYLRPQPLIDPTEVQAAIQLAIGQFRRRTVTRVVTPSVPEQPMGVVLGEFVPMTEGLQYDLGVIAAWKSWQLQEACRTIGLEFVPHPTNAGLTAMRARNAIANWLKKGNRLPTTP